ncbi:hypothetical protein HID58_095350, partial [Brassica napus]
ERLQKSKLLIYVELLQNEFVSDATVEINSYITGAGINGTITEFPFTASKYKVSVLNLNYQRFHNTEFLTSTPNFVSAGNRCLGQRNSLPYMAPVIPRGLLQMVNPFSSPSSKHSSKPSSKPVFKDDYVAGPPLPPNLIFTNDGRYKLCSQPFSCGDQKDLLYPFWIPDREDSGFAELTVSSVKFRILMADYDLHFITLARMDYTDNLCPSNPRNEQFNQSALQFADGTKLLTILYDCRDLPSNISNSLVYNYVTDFQCEEDMEGLRNYCFVKNSSSALLYMRDGTKDLEKNCKKEVSIPVRESTLPSLCSDNPNKSLEKGFNLEIKQDCLVCLESNGACGYNRGFVCYCDDGLMDITVMGLWSTQSTKDLGSICGFDSRRCSVRDLITILSSLSPDERITSETTESEVPHSTQTLHLCKGEKNYKVICGSGRERRIWNYSAVRLSYPFWKPGRKACGHPEFELNCSGDFAELNISTVKFRIIDSGYYETTLIRTDYIDNLYPRNPLNAQFNENVVSFPYNTELVTIYYDCPNFSPLIPHSFYVGELVSGNNRRNYYVTKNLTSPLLEEIRGLLNNFREMCKRNVSIPASGSALETLQRSPNTYNLKKAIEQGFDLYVNSDCERCMVSEGACGYNQTSSAFVCYCKDGPHNSSCPTHNRADLIEGIVIVIIILVGIIALVVLLCPCFGVQIFRKRKTSDDRRQKKLKALIPLKHYTYAQVKKITKSFAEVVGRGGFGVSSPSNRPPMNIVVEMMEGSLEALEVPPMPVLQQIPAARLSQSFWDSGEGSSASELLSFSLQAQSTKTPPTTDFTFEGFSKNKSEIQTEGAAIITPDGLLRLTDRNLNVTGT